MRDRVFNAGLIGLDAAALGAGSLMEISAISTADHGSCSANVGTRTNVPVSRWAARPVRTVRRTFRAL